MFCRKSHLQFHQNMFMSVKRNCPFGRQPNWLSAAMLQRVQWLLGSLWCQLVKQCCCEAAVMSQNSKRFIEVSNRELRTKVDEETAGWELRNCSLNKRWVEVKQEWGKKINWGRKMCKENKRKGQQARNSRDRESSAKIEGKMGGIWNKNKQA